MDVMMEAFDRYLNSWDISQIVLKVTNRCTFKCSYCFWFRDESVKAYPHFISEEILYAIRDKIDRHVSENEIENFKIILHGGEPLLLGYERFEKMLQILSNSVCCFNLQTNGSLIDDKWCEIFKKYKINVGVSIDGPEHIHNENRRTIDGRETFHLVKRGIDCLKTNNIDFGILSVCNPETSPQAFLNFIVNELGVMGFDVLIPDLNHDDKHLKKEISSYYKELFDVWVNQFIERGVNIRIFENIISQLVCTTGSCESFGYGPMQVVTIETNGDITPTDILRISRSYNLDSGLNIKENEIRAIKGSPIFRELIMQSLKLSNECVSCKYNLQCGGGCFPHRWSSITNDFKNPSVYCNEIYKIFSHIEKYLKHDLVLIKS